MLRLVDRANTGRRGRLADASGDAGDAGAALECAFACSQRLAVYGTLAPGECNYHLLAACQGPWLHGAVRGRLATREHRVLTYDPRAGLVLVQMLTSPGLPGQWTQLDAFEQPTHRRILVPVFAGGRLLAVANLYEACDPVEPA